jgi:hypothetical protein
MSLSVTVEIFLDAVVRIQIKGVSGRQNEGYTLVIAVLPIAFYEPRYPVTFVAAQCTKVCRSSTDQTACACCYAMPSANSIHNLSPSPFSDEPVTDKRNETLAEERKLDLAVVFV